MTDQERIEQAEQIAKHEGWGKWAKLNYRWATGDWFYCKKNKIRQLVTPDIMLGMVQPNLLAIIDARCDVPIPSELYLMDMLEAKGYEHADKSKLHDGSYFYEVHPEKIGIIPTVKSSAPTRLLALFKVVTKVYDINGD